MNLLSLVVTALIALGMFYTGLLCSLSQLRCCMTRQHLRALTGLAVINFVLVPLLALAFFVFELQTSGLWLAIVTLAILRARGVLHRL